MAASCAKNACFLLGSVCGGGSSAPIAMPASPVLKAMDEPSDQGGAQTFGSCGRPDQDSAAATPSFKVLHEAPAPCTVNDISGHIYVQFDTVGLASYHFEETGGYISYEGAPLSWRMDHGHAFPLRQYFSNSSYDPATRTFRGQVIWTVDTVSGAKKVVYEMVFDELFKTIEGGHISAFAEVDGSDELWKAAFATQVIRRTRWYGDNPYASYGAQKSGLTTKMSFSMHALMSTSDGQEEELRSARTMTYSVHSQNLVDGESNTDHADCVPQDVYALVGQGVQYGQGLEAVAPRMYNFLVEKLLSECECSG